VGIEKLLESGMDGTIFRRSVGDGAGDADGRGPRDEYQRDHRNCKGQFHGTPPMEMSGHGHEKRFETMLPGAMQCSRAAGLARKNT
jgi:hypothetical protein